MVIGFVEGYVLLPFGLGSFLGAVFLTALLVWRVALKWVTVIVGFAREPQRDPLLLSLGSSRYLCGTPWPKPTGKKMSELIGFVIAYMFYLGALLFFLQSADLSIRMIA